jgi:hypothetical protein
MIKKTKRLRIRRSDYCRVLITETLPFETPIIFSNDGLYENIINIDSANGLLRQLLCTLVFGEGEGKNEKFTVPYRYKIRKDSTGFRRLALLHPRSQWKIKEFYERYESLILYYCTQSPASIRYPHKVAGSFFLTNSAAKINQYRTGSVSLTKFDEISRHSPSFFAYKYYDRLYKFFKSRDYFELEKQYSHIKILDVSKCFDSIYT